MLISWEIKFLLPKSKLGELFMEKFVAMGHPVEI